MGAVLELRSVGLETGRRLKDPVSNDLLENAWMLIWYIIVTGIPRLTCFGLV